MLAAFALIIMLAGSTLLAMGIEPVPTWFYVIMWYPILVLADEFVHATARRERVLASPARVVSLFGWSAVIWLVFEVANFRLHNWYYVFLPTAPVERWIGILVSFATVVPAVILAERTLGAVGVGRTWRSRPLAFRPGDRRGVMFLGVVSLGLVAVWPEVFFPLIWVSLWLLSDPLVHARHPQWSLLNDAERGDWGRIGRLMLGGLGIGLLWETLNFVARAKWIYTVPWLEHLKLFEMPPLGFLGFPFLALEAWSLYHLLCSLGLATPVAAGDAPARSLGTRLVSWLTAGVFAAVALAGMERRTISSTTPLLPDAPTLSAAELQQLREGGYSSVFRLAAAGASAVADGAGVSPEVATRVTQWATLVTLRGIGTGHAETLATVGVRTVCALARRTPGGLWNAIKAVHEDQHGGQPLPRPGPAEVRIWVVAARRACAEQYTVTISTAVIHEGH